MAVRKARVEITERDLILRQARAVVSLVFRILALPILVTLLCRQSPALNTVRPLLEAASVALALFPFFTTWGRLTTARIALGRAYAERGDWAAAVRLLKPLGAGLGARLFDAAGEGRYYLALALEASGQVEMAQRVFRQVAGEIGERSEWGRLARGRSGAAPLPPTSGGF